MEDVTVVITTFQRAEQLGRVVQALRKGFDGTILVFDDGSGKLWRPKYELALEGLNVKYAQAPSNYGHNNWWAFIDKIFKLLERDLESALFIQDDSLPCKNMVKKTVEIFESIDDPLKIALSPLLDGRYKEGIWGAGKPVKVPRAWRTGWLDMFFYAPREFFELLEWTIRPCRPRGRNHSTGVGIQITQRIREAGRHIYHVDKSLLKNGWSESVMYPGIRRGDSMNSI